MTRAPQKDSRISTGRLLRWIDEQAYIAEQDGKNLGNGEVAVAYFRGKSVALRRMRAYIEDTAK